MAKNSDEKHVGSEIANWVPKANEIYVTHTDKKFIVLFERFFKAENVNKYNEFLYKKSAYEKQLDMITNYINYFINKYDTKQELPLAYLELKYLIDNKDQFNEDNYRQLISSIYKLMFTDNIKDAISRLVEDNYVDDIESTDNSRRYSGKEKKHLESLEFTNEHIKILLKISFSMKLISPVLLHFIAKKAIKITAESTMLYDFYIPLFDMFSDTVNIYNKLFVYVKTKVLESRSHNLPIFEQNEILGFDEYNLISKFINKTFISDNIIKYKFSKIWDSKLKKYKESVIGFNKTIVKYQLIYFLKEQHEKNLTEVTSTKNAEGLSGMDKMEMNMNKVDEGLTILSEMMATLGIRKIYEEYSKFNISDEELEYYKVTFKPTPLQSILVYSYFANYFGAYRNTYAIPRMDFIKLSLILKRILLEKAGCKKVNKFYESAILPYILTGNLVSKSGNNLVEDANIISIIESSEDFAKLKCSKYGILSTVRNDILLNIIKELIEAVFSFVTYEDKDRTGEKIEYGDLESLSKEIVDFLLSIK